MSAPVAKTEKREYTPKMIEIKDAKVEDVRAVLPYYIKVWQEDKDTIVFNTTPLTLRQMREKYGKDRVTVKNSDASMYHDAIKG